jgi:Uma2 family endonuclease
MSTIIPTSFDGPSDFAFAADPPPGTLAELVHRLGDIPLDRIRTQPPPGLATVEDAVECKAKQNCICELVDGVLVAKAGHTPPGNLAELIHQLGDIPLHRIRSLPPPGTATPADAAESKAKQGCLCELVDGVLVEKAMGYREGIIEAIIIAALQAYNHTRRLGKVTSPSSMFRMQKKVVRLPDVAFTFWHRFPKGKVTREQTPELVPDLAVEVLSPSNTRGEMERKRAEYFAAGTRLVWMVDLDQRTVTVYTAADTCTVLQQTDTLDGGDLLPGFTLSLSELFAELDEEAPQA